MQQGDSAESCWICLDDTGPLVTPCHCVTRRVHAECLVSLLSVIILSSSSHRHQRRHPIHHHHHHQQQQQQQPTHPRLPYAGTLANPTSRHKRREPVQVLQSASPPLGYWHYPRPCTPCTGGPYQRVWARWLLPQSPAPTWAGRPAGLHTQGDPSAGPATRLCTRLQL